MGFEDNMINSLDRRNPGEHPVIEKMHQRAIETLSEDAIDPNDFEDLYGAETIRADLAHVERLKSKFERDEIQKAAEVLEAIMYLHSELSEWLGSNAETIRPSEYDDYVNGVDLITEFSTEDTTRHLALGVDITFGSQTIGKKFERIKKEIDEDELAQVKYFESHGFRGQLKQLPRIVVGVERETVIELAGLWMNRKNAELGGHVAKFIIISEIIEQLRTHRDYAERNGKVAALKSFRQALAVAKELQGGLKELTKEQRELISQDRVYQGVRANLRIKFSK